MTGAASLRRSDPDATVRLRPRRRRRLVLPMALSLGAVALLGLWLALRPAGLPRADEAALLAADPAAFRFRPAPAIVVVVFRSLHDQALALNRAALFVERAGVPHDRVLDEAAARAAIARGKDSFDAMYDGHDYRSSDLARFFATARADHIALNPREQQMQALLQRAGVLRPGANQALITLTVAGAGLLDAAGRATILRHELSHGLYFTDSAYAGYTAHWWAGLTPAERAGLRAVLASQGYDSADDDLMRNEAQAYLIHTPDRRFFAPAAASLTEPEWRRLRTAFIAGMKPGWLRDRTAP